MFAKKKFAENLKRIRMECGLTQLQVAEAIGLDRSTYAYYELAKTSPDIKTIEKLVKIFDITYDQLFDDYEVRPSTVTFKSPQSLDDVCILPKLSKDEKLLLSLFRLLPNDYKKNVIKDINKKIEEAYLNTED